MGIGSDSPDVAMLCSPEPSSPQSEMELSIPQKYCNGKKTLAKKPSFVSQY